MALEGHEVDRFVFIAVGKDAPYTVGVYELDERSLQEGRAAVDYALDKFVWAQKSGVWGYDYGELQTIQIPPYTFKFTKSKIVRRHIMPISFQNETQASDMSYVRVNLPQNKWTLKTPTGDIEEIDMSKGIAIDVKNVVFGWLHIDVGVREFLSVAVTGAAIRKA